MGKRVKLTYGITYGCKKRVDRRDENVPAPLFIIPYCAQIGGADDRSGRTTYSLSSALTLVGANAGGGAGLTIGRVPAWGGRGIHLHVAWGLHVL